MVLHHISMPPRATPMNGAEFRPQRFDIANGVQVFPDWRVAPGVLVLDQFIIGAAGAERGVDLFGRQHRAA